MSCIHYKFKSSLDYNSVTFDGLHLSLADLKKAIIQQKRLKPGEFDLEITNAQTNDVYKKNDELIAKNTSVIVSRVPMNKTTASSTQKSWEAFKQECAKVKEKERLMTLEKLKQTPDLVNAPASEIDKIKAVIDQSTKGFESSSLLGKNQSTVPHEHYVCKRCGQKGHFVSTCPNSNAEDRIVEPRYKRTTGIPSTMLTIVDDPMHPGALLTHHGQFAVPTVDVLGYRETKKERPPFLPGESQPEPEKKKIPQELLCHICEDLCVDAAIAPCCGTSFCDECLREVLLESDDHQCPSCKETNVSPDRIVANRSMRLAVTNFLNDTGYTKARRRRTLSSGPEGSQTKALSPRKLSPSRPLISTGPTIKQEASSGYTDSQESGNNVHHNVQHNTTSVMQGNNEARHHNPSYRSYGRPPRFNYHQQQFHKPWRYSNDRQNDRRTDQSSVTTWRKENNYNSVSSHSLSDGTSASPVPEQTLRDNSRIIERPPSADNTVTSNISTVTTNANENAVSQSSAQSRGQHHWPQLAGSAAENPANVLVTPAHLLNAASFLLANSIPLLNAPPPTHRPYQAMQGYHHQMGYQATRPAAPVPVSGGLLPAPMSKEEFYQTKKMIQQADIPKKKPIDVFDSFADLTKRRSRTPERRRSYSRSRSGSWKKHSRSRSHSVGKKRSLSPRRRNSRSHSRSRSRSRQRSQHRSHSRSLGPSRISRQHSRSLTPLARKSKSRSRSGPRSPKALSPRTCSPLPPLRRSSKSPLPPRSRSRSRSYKRFTRSRSKSWSKRTRSRSFSRPRSPRPYSRSPRRSPRRSPVRSPLHKTLYSPRRKSRSYSPRRRSPFRSRSRTPLKRISSRSRTRSPYLKKSFSPARSPQRAKSPYKKPISPVQLRRLSPQPYRGGQFRQRGRGRFGYRDNDKFRSYHSPPRLQLPLPPPVLPTNLPPVPYNPQMGLPPPEEYFKYNPSGYQEFVRNFYAQFGPQAQAWAQNQTFQLPNSDGISSNPPQNNPYMPNQRMGMPWESVPMSPSQRPRSITPPRNRKDQSFRENPRIWDKDNRDRRGDRGRETDRSREFDQHRKEMGERKFSVKEDDRYKFRESRDSGKPREKPTSDRKISPSSKARDENKTKEKRRHEKKKEEKEKKTKKRWDGDSKKEKNELKESTLKTSPVSDQELSLPQLAEKADSREILKTKSYSVLSVVDTVNKSVHADSVEQPVSEVKTEKPLLKERKPVGKKKGEGLGGKKKSREGLADDGEKKGKKTKKKKLTFGSSDADSKQGLKKKKVKRLVDYKSENCASEDGEDRGSPLKKAKLSEGEEKKDEIIESNLLETAHVNTSEPTFEVSTEAEKNTAGENIFEEMSSIDLKLEGDKDEKELNTKTKCELVPEVPQLSKWERDDFDLFEAIEQPKEKAQEKMMLPRSVVDKAEKFLSHKPMKNAVIAAPTTASSKSPESPQASDKRGADTVPSRRVFIERKDSRDKKTSDLQITVKTDKNKNENSKRILSTKTEEGRHRYHHNDSDYEEDQRSVVKSHSLERELQEKSKYRRSREREKKREDRDTKRDEKEASKRDERKDSRSHKDSSIEKNFKNDKKEKTDSVKDKQKDSRDSESKEKRHSKDLAITSSTDTHKSSKDLRHKLEEKAKAKSTIDPRKLSVLDESEFVPDYEDLGVDMSSDKEINEAVVTQRSTSPETPTNESKRRKKDEESETKTEETDTEEGIKHKKSKKKHKHKEKNKEKKEKHKHKKKKHKHKKSKEEKESNIQSS